MYLDGVHHARLQVHEDGARHELAAAGVVVEGGEVLTNEM